MGSSQRFVWRFLPLWGRRALDHNGSRVNHQICGSVIVDLHNGRTAQRGDLFEALLTAAARSCVPVIFFGADSSGRFGAAHRADSGRSATLAKVSIQLTSDMAEFSGPSERSD